MDWQSIIYTVTLTSLFGAPIVMLLGWIIFSKDNPNQIDKNGNFIPGNGPKCDICGRYLKNHKMLECERYC